MKKDILKVIVFLAITTIAYFTLVSLFSYMEKKESHPLCGAGKKVAGDVANGIAAVLECNNQAQIRLELYDVLQSLNLCGKEMFALTDFSFKANVVCPVVANFVSQKFEESIPINWECKPKKFIAQIHEKVQLGCVLSLERK
jgi:hypothetical protein